MRTIALVLCVSTLMYAVAPEVMADTGKRRAAAMTDEEDRALAEREARTPGLANFEAGDALGVVLVVVLIVLIVVLIWYLLEGQYHRSYPISPR